MREILFRGKRVDNGEWTISGDIRQLNYGGVYLWHRGNWIEVYPETVGQYTGLTDKNGKEIFEGDIVKGDIPELFPHYTGRTGKVEWGESAWIVDFSDRYPAYDLKKVGFCSFGNYEVIGNIHDTPELLEDSND